MTGISDQYSIQRQLTTPFLQILIIGSIVSLSLSLYVEVYVSTMWKNVIRQYPIPLRFEGSKSMVSAYRGRDDQRELAVAVVVVHRFTEYESGSVAGFERKFASLVAFHYRIMHVAVRRVRFVPIHRVDPAKYRHACRPRNSTSRVVISTIIINFLILGRAINH